MWQRSNKDAPRVRWWVVAGAIIAGWALSCFGPTSAEGQVVVRDELTLATLSRMSHKETIACAAATWVSKDVLNIDSIVAAPKELACPAHTNTVIVSMGLDSVGLAINPASAVHVGVIVLNNFPAIMAACAWGQSMDHPERRRLWCVYREKKDP